MQTILEEVKALLPKGVATEFSGNAVFFEIPAEKMVELIVRLRDENHLSLKLITATDERAEKGGFKIWYVLGMPGKDVFIVPFIWLKNGAEFPSLAQSIHEAWNHERKIRTFFGLEPKGHPDQRPVILHENWPADVFPLRKDFDWNERPAPARGVYRFQAVSGEGIYEIPVGPIHAGIIEPGHFRFSVAGEEIVLLEAKLGYVHKGSEKMFERLSLPDKVRLSEKISGDSSFSHSLAFCQAVERLADVAASGRARYLRVVYAELERLANHLGDLGAMMLDTGFNFGGSQGARLRESVMRINERLAGNRFLRGVNAIGGVTRDIGAKERLVLDRELSTLSKDLAEVIAIAEDSVSLLNRLKGTGVLSRGIAEEHGVVGLAARAVGVANDARYTHPYAAYGELLVGEMALEQGGDAYTRFQVRIKEVGASIELIRKALAGLPEDGLALPAKLVLKKGALAVGAVEGWRGEIIYFVKTDHGGNIDRVAVRDPSFMNWGALGHAGAGNVVPDFPLINKSFNLSYSGNDL